MSLKLPLQDSPVRELFDVRDLAAFGHPDNRIRAGSFRDTLVKSREWLAKTPDAVAVNQFVFRANGDLWLIKVTRKSWAKVWNFGQ